MTTLTPSTGETFTTARSIASVTKCTPRLSSHTLSSNNIVKIPLVINKCFHISAGCSTLLLKTMEGQTVVSVGTRHHQLRTSCLVLELKQKNWDLLAYVFLKFGIDLNSLLSNISSSSRAFRILRKATLLSLLKARLEVVDDLKARKPAAAAPRPPFVK